jgi:hypothetical protein
VTTDEQYAAIGKAHADLKAKRQSLKALRLTADGLGDQFIKLGKLLKHSPEVAGLEGESPMAVTTVPPDSQVFFDRKIFDGDRFRDLTRDIREAIEAIDDLERKLGD